MIRDGLQLWKREVGETLGKIVKDGGVTGEHVLALNNVNGYGVEERGEAALELGTICNDRFALVVLQKCANPTQNRLPNLIRGS